MVYYIEAQVYLNGHVVCEAIREIIVMPVAEAPPPMDQAGLVNEYSLFASTTLGTYWRRKNALVVSVSSSEPRPLLFEASGAMEDPSSTALQLTFLVRHMHMGDDFKDVTEPEISNCDLIITLEATTYFLRDEEHSVLSIAEARGTPHSVVKTTKFKPQRLKVKLLNWDRAKDSTCTVTLTQVEAPN